MQLVERSHPQRDLLHAQLVPQKQILFGDLRLLFQRADLHFELFDLVVDAHKVFLGALQLALGLLLAVAETGNARRFLKHVAPVGAAGGDDLRDAALADDGIAVAPEAGVHEQGVDVLEAHGLFVDIVLALSTAVIATGEHDLRAVGIEDAGGVVDDERDLRVAHGPALLRAAEDDVLHLAAAQGLGALLAHDPEDRVGDIRFAGAVRPHNGGDVFFKAQARLVREGFEALNLQCL